MKTKLFFALLIGLLLHTGTSNDPPHQDENYLSIAYLDEKVDFQHNIIYSPAFRAAWTRLKEDVIGEDLLLAEPCGFAYRMNGHPFRPVHGDEWIIRAGYVREGIIDSIQNDVNQKYGEHLTTFDRYKREQDAIICYARFSEKAEFSHVFETMEWDFLYPGGSSKVSCFGIGRSTGQEDKSPLHGQVAIYDYKNPDDFIVRLATANPDHEVILAKVEPERTLLATLDKVNERIRTSYADAFGNTDELVIPKVSIITEKVYGELIGKFLANEGFEEYFFASAQQQVDFQMNESGVTVQATGEIVLQKGPRNRIYAFDRPYLVLFREIGSDEPDLVAWISEPSCMIPAE